ncbi:ArsR family transcriptional regulator [Ktedonosporobacter rubrisoli]|uniref:ArsR family transcriptional regulator n=1 Tax=Ktedonosporobacter rubrisoli TaxID=2509675 RepID=A0A4P6JMU2_KTERU|nr:winged helix-turn-helix domain-containing protein [Ktedonosporobacter rubrisoli]QBD76463.1 ArsR family transcriptional regulator [Ktedonosporobacter rubrisoli]
MAKQRTSGWRSPHRALADPLRIRLLEALWERPQSAKELAEWTGVPSDRLYYHLTQLEEAKLIEIAEYRRLSGGKVERIYRPTEVEPPGDVATPEELAHFLSASLEATQVDIATAGAAQEAGERRDISLVRTTLRLKEAELAELRGHILELLRKAQEEPDDEGTWTRVVFALVDLQARKPSTNGGDSA